MRNGGTFGEMIVPGSLLIANQMSKRRFQRNNEPSSKKRSSKKRSSKKRSFKKRSFKKRSFKKRRN